MYFSNFNKDKLEYNITGFFIKCNILCICYFLPSVFYHVTHMHRVV